MPVYLPSLTVSRTFKGLLKSWKMIMFLRWKHHLDTTWDCKAGEGTLLGHICETFVLSVIPAEHLPQRGGGVF